MARPPSVFNAASVRVSRFLLIVGVGVLSFFGGSVVAAYVIQRLAFRIGDLPVPLRFALNRGLQGLWVLGALPAVCYGLALILDIKPWTTPIGAAITGEILLTTIGYIQNGFDVAWQDLLARGVCLAVGVFLSAKAIEKAKAVQARSQEQATKAAEAKKNEYEAFAKEAERLAERHEATEKPPQVPPEAKGP